MNDEFKIFVDQLRGGKIENIDYSFPTDLLEVIEADLSFYDNVVVGGEAYVANNDLVLHLDIETKGLVPCLVCNEPVDIELQIAGHYHIVSLKEIKTGVFNMRELIREVILLDIPEFAECEEGNCPKRKEFKKYLKESPAQKKHEDQDCFQPFMDLTLEE